MLKFYRLDSANMDKWFSTTTLRILLSAMLVFSVFIGPYSYAAERHAQHHENPLSMDHHGGGDHHGPPDGEDHSGVGHALTHCGSTACSPSFVGTPDLSTVFAYISFRLHSLFVDDLDLPSLYLDGDPPVPRSGFSLI